MKRGGMSHFKQLFYVTLDNYAGADFTKPNFYIKCNAKNKKKQEILI